MESSSINLNWPHFSSLSEEYPICSMRFQAFAQIKGLFDTITVDNPPPKPIGGFGSDPTDVERAAHDGAEATYRRALHDIEKRKNNLWCHLAMVLDSTSLMLITYDCVDNKGLGKTRNFPSANF